MVKVPLSAGALDDRREEDGRSHAQTQGLRKLNGLNNVTLPRSIMRIRTLPRCAIVRGGRLSTGRACNSAPEEGKGKEMADPVSGR